MNLTNQILAPKENFVDFIKNYPSQTPLVMVNILKFKDQTADGKTGEEEYNIDFDNQPDRFLVVYYPSKEAFIEMSTSEEYAAIGHHRHLSLEYGGLIATETIG